MSRAVALLLVALAALPAGCLTDGFLPVYERAWGQTEEARREVQDAAKRFRSVAAFQDAEVRLANARALLVGWVAPEAWRESRSILLGAMGRLDEAIVHAGQCLRGVEEDCARFEAANLAVVRALEASAAASPKRLIL